MPGFRQFMVERFAAECCIYKLVEPSFNFRDANTVSSLFPSIYIDIQDQHSKLPVEFGPSAGSMLG